MAERGRWLSLAGVVLAVMVALCWGGQVLADATPTPTVTATPTATLTPFPTWTPFASFGDAVATEVWRRYPVGAIGVVQSAIATLFPTATVEAGAVVTFPLGNMFDDGGGGGGACVSAFAQSTGDAFEFWQYANIMTPVPTIDGQNESYASVYAVLPTVVAGTNTQVRILYYAHPDQVYNSYQAYVAYYDPSSGWQLGDLKNTAANSDPDDWAAPGWLVQSWPAWTNMQRAGVVVAPAPPAGAQAINFDYSIYVNSTPYPVTPECITGEPGGGGGGVEIPNYWDDIEIEFEVSDSFSALSLPISRFIFGMAFVLYLIGRARAIVGGR